MSTIAERAQLMREKRDREGRMEQITLWLIEGHTYREIAELQGNSTERIRQLWLQFQRNLAS